MTLYAVANQSIAFPYAPTFAARQANAASTEIAFQYSLSVLKIYSARYIYYRFSVLTVNSM